MPSGALYVDLVELGEVLGAWAVRHNAEHGHDPYANRLEYREVSIQMPAHYYLAHWGHSSPEGVRKILNKDLRSRKRVTYDLAERLLIAAGEEHALLDGRLTIYRRIGNDQYVSTGGGGKS